MVWALLLLLPLVTRGGRGSAGFRLQQRLDAAIASHAPTFTLPPGDISFARCQEHADRGGTGGTTLWFQPGGGLKIADGANVTLSGVTIDYNPLPYVQAEIIAMQELYLAKETAVSRPLPAAALSPCTTPTSPQQTWSLVTPFKGFISNVGNGSASAPQFCLNVNDCTTSLIYDGCPHTEAKNELTCAGKGNYSIFEFALQTDGNASHQQLRSVFGEDCVATVHSSKCTGCAGDPCTKRNNQPCFGCSASNGCRDNSVALVRGPCDPRDDTKSWRHAANGQLRSGPRSSSPGLCLTATEKPAPPPPPQQRSMKYTLRLANRSPLFNATCARPNDNQNSPWDNNASVCEHYGINQLFGADRAPKIGSDFGSCPPLPASMCPMPSVPSVGAFEEVGTGNRTYTAVMPSMLDGNGTSVAKVGDFLTYSGRDWYTYVLANSSNVTTAGISIHSSSGFTIVELDGECSHTFRGVNVIRRDGYMIASNGDVFHSSEVPGRQPLKTLRLRRLWMTSTTSIQQCKSRPVL